MGKGVEWVWKPLEEEMANYTSDAKGQNRVFVKMIAAEKSM